MLYHLIIGPTLLVLLMLGWWAFQEWVRRETPNLKPDCDVLESRFLDCHGCHHSKQCQLHPH